MCSNAKNMTLPTCLLLLSYDFAVVNKSDSIERNNVNLKNPALYDQKSNMMITMSLPLC